jgi:hypothetical protein
MILHTFKLDTITDEPYVELYPKLSNFLSTEKGRWIQERVQGEIEHKTDYDMYNMQYRVVVNGQLSEEDTLWFNLKWGDINVR